MEEVETTPTQPLDTAWRLSFALLLAVVIGWVALQVALVFAREDSSDGEGVRALLAGDFNIQCAVAGVEPGTMARKAIASYESALPWPAAYRRIGITKIVFLHRSQAPELQLLSSKAALKSVPKDRVPKLRAEEAMWAEVFGRQKISAARANEFVRKVRTLNLGPLREVAVAEVLRRSGQTARADAAIAGAKRNAVVKLLSFAVVVLAAIGGGLTGLVIAIFFFNGLGIRRTPVAIGPLPSVVLRGFLVYLLSTALIEFALSGLADMIVHGYEDSSTAAALLLQMSATLAGVALAINYIGTRAPGAGAVLRDIGLRATAVRQTLKWAVGGYCATLPFMLAALIFTQLVLRTILKGVPPSEHPIVPLVESGGVLTWVVAFLLAVVVAPLVEEIAFRGLLYTALRARMGMWASVIISGTIFAALHPTIPEAFLVLSVLGCAFALIRERSGSLVPSMVCHGIHNGMLFLVLWVVK